MPPQTSGVSPEEMRGTPPVKDAYFDYGLPPLHRLEDIFEDITEKTFSKGLGGALKFLENRPLRVATVCSGTESPLLALQMVKKGQYRV